MAQKYLFIAIFCLVVNKAKERTLFLFLYFM